MTSVFLFRQCSENDTLLFLGGKMGYKNAQPRGKPQGIKTKDNGKSVRSKGREIGPGEIKALERKDEYLLGIREIDLQHRRIFHCFVAMAGEELPKQDIRIAEFSIVQFVGLLREHFALEESLMRILGYPELERHIEEHRQFNAVLHLGQQSLRTKGSAPHEMIKVIQKWHREHVMTSDRHYADYFSGLTRKSVGKKRGAK
jgi:hemerythrin